MIKLKLIIFSILCFCVPAFAQLTLPQVIHAGPDDTICSNIPVNLTCTIDSGTQGNLLIIQDDTYSQIVNIGFPFTFFGNTYTQCLLSTNAYITFDLTGPPGGGGPGTYSPWPIGSPIPSAADPVNSIMGPWHDVDPSVPSSGNMSFGTFGTAPNRFFVFNFCSIPMFSCNNLLFTGQIILYEGSDIIETHIGNKPLCASWNTGQAIHGLQDATGTNAVVVPGRNSGVQWTTSNEGTQFVPSGNTYIINSIPYNPVPFAASPPQWTTLAGQIVGNGFSISVSPTQTTSYIVSTTDCAVSRDTVTVFVGTFTSNDSIVNPSCNSLADGSIFTTPNGNTGPYTYIWTNDVGGIIHTSNTNGGDGVPNLGSGVYHVIITNSFGCSITQDFTLTAGNYNAAFVYSPLNICNGSPVSFTDASTGNINGYNWNFGDGGTSTQQNPSHTFTQDGPVTVQLIVGITGGCTDTATVQLNIIPVIVADYIYSPATACTGVPISYTDLSSNNPIQWVWDFGDASGSTTQNPSHSFATSGTYNVTLQVIDSLCGSSSITQSIDINYIPNPYLGLDTGLCVTEKITLDAGYAGNAFLWSTGATTQTITVTASDPSWFWVTVNNAGCTGTDSIFIDIKCDVNLPNAFSPNSDGKNDLFRPITKKVDAYELHVFNRWGNEVYTYNGSGSGGGWDGTYKGTDAEVGVYDYYLKAKFINGVFYEQQGNVTLLR